MWVSEVSNNPAQANASAEICSSMQLLTQHYYSQEKKSARTINSFKAWPIVELLKGKKEKDREWVGGLGRGQIKHSAFPPLKYSHFI